MRVAAGIRGPDKPSIEAGKSEGAARFHIFHLGPLADIPRVGAGVLDPDHFGIETGLSPITA